MKKILVIGYKGFIGNTIYNKLKNECNGYDIYGLLHGDDICEFILKNGDFFDVIVNANGNSKKYWANNNPMEDFKKTIQSVYEQCINFKCKNYIYISSMDVYNNHYYGKNKMIAESIINTFFEYKTIFLRCSSVIGKDMKKGVLYDILNDRTVYLCGDSKLKFITNTEIANIVNVLIHRDKTNLIFNCTGVGNVSIGEIGELTNKEIKYANDLRYEYYADYITDVKEVYNVKTSLEYIKEVIDE